MKKLYFLNLLVISSLIAKPKKLEEYNACKAQCVADVIDNSNECHIDLSKANVCRSDCQNRYCRANCYEKHQNDCKKSNECKKAEKCINSKKSDCKEEVRACAEKCESRKACLEECNNVQDLLLDEEDSCSIKSDTCYCYKDGEMIGSFKNSDKPCDQTCNQKFKKYEGKVTARCN